MRKYVSSGSSWEDLVGYSRAIRVGNFVEVAGTTAVDGDQLVGKGDAYEQARFIFQKIDIALKQLGSSLNDVVRTRMYVINISDWEAIGRAHSEVFKDIKPVATMVEVSSLIDKDLLLEVEVTAVIE